MSVRIVFDQGVCQGHGQCEMIAPHSFRMDEESGLAMLIAEIQDDSRKDDLIAAMRACPVGAIKIVGE